MGLFGLSFKADTDDLRESPQIEIIERLIGKGYAVRIYDRNVSLSKIKGANRQFLLERIPHVSSLIVDDFESVLEKSEIVVIGNNSLEFAKLPTMVLPHQELIDLTGLLSRVSGASANGEVG